MDPLFLHIGAGKCLFCELSSLFCARGADLVIEWVQTFSQNRSRPVGLACPSCFLIVLLFADARHSDLLMFLPLPNLHLLYFKSRRFYYQPITCSKDRSAIAETGVTLSLVLVECVIVVDESREEAIESSNLSLFHCVWHKNEPMPKGCQFFSTHHSWIDWLLDQVIDTQKVFMNNERKTLGGWEETLICKPLSQKESILQVGQFPERRIQVRSRNTLVGLFIKV